MMDAAIDPPIVVMVVEDDADIAAALRDVLDNEGFRTVLAANVAEAVILAGTDAPALVLLDWNLPDGNGGDVVRRLRPTMPMVPIIVMSAAREALEASLGVDARERLAKPLDVDRLVGLVRSYLG